MRYVGRHRGPRPLLLRRPVLGGAAAICILAVPGFAVAAQQHNGVQPSTSGKNTTLADPAVSPDVTNTGVPVIPSGAATSPATGPASTHPVSTTHLVIQTTLPGVTHTTVSPTRSPKPPTTTKTPPPTRTTPPTTPSTPPTDPPTSTTPPDPTTPPAPVDPGTGDPSTGDPTTPAAP